MRQKQAVQDLDSQGAQDRALTVHGSLREGKQEKFASEKLFGSASVNTEEKVKEESGVNNI